VLKLADFSQMAKLYTELAAWWPLMSAPEEYALEAQSYVQVIRAIHRGQPRTLLELGSGGGNNASHMKKDFALTLVEPSEGMLAHMITLQDLQRAIETAFVHCATGGVALFCPDAVCETCVADTEHGGHDGKDGDPRSMRWLAWTFDPDPGDDTYTVDYAFVLHEADGSVRVEADRHIKGLFAREDWLHLLRGAGFDPAVVPFEHPEVAAGRYEMFACRK